MDEEYRMGSVHTSVLCAITCGDSVGLEDLFACLIDLYSLIPRSLAGVVGLGPQFFLMRISPRACSASSQHDSWRLGVSVPRDRKWWCPVS